MEHKPMVGFALCGSFCTHAKALDALEKVLEQFPSVVPIVSRSSAETDTRFGTSDALLEKLETLCGRRVISSIKEA